MRLGAAWCAVPARSYQRIEGGDEAALVRVFRERGWAHLRCVRDRRVRSTTAESGSSEDQALATLAGRSGGPRCAAGPYATTTSSDTTSWEQFETPQV